MPTRPQIMRNRALLSASPVGPWSWSFVLTAFESAVVTGLAGFTASDVFANPSVKNLETGAITAGLTVLYQFVKNLGVSQTLDSIKNFGRDG